MCVAGTNQNGPANQRQADDGWTLGSQTRMASRRGRIAMRKYPVFGELIEGRFGLVVRSESGNAC